MPTLLESITSKFKLALQNKHIVWLESSSYMLRDREADFLIRKAAGFVKKEDSDFARTNTNPFLPYDSNLYVCDVRNGSHVLLFNKFCVVENHLLLITKAFEQQTDALTLADFEALVETWDDSFAVFYNCGPNSGASQPHKHIQMVPFASALPIENFFISNASAGQITTCLSLPFEHYFAQLGDILPSSLLDLYQHMLTKMRDPSISYNLILTKKWMFLVPRSRESVENIRINSIGFLGWILTKSEEESKFLHEKGPLEVLRLVAFSPTK